MIDLRFFISSVLRWRVLFIFTVVTVIVAFFLFVLLISMNRLFDDGVDMEQPARLVVSNDISIMQPLPLSYEAQIGDVEGVDIVSKNVFFGAFYQDPSSGLMAIATEPRQFLSLMSEVTFKYERYRDNWVNDPATILVGRELAEKHGWKEGDLVPLFSYLYRRSGGNRTGRFVLRESLTVPRRAETPTRCFCTTPT